MSHATRVRPAVTGHPGVRPTLHAVPWALGAGVVGVQIAFPLTGGGTPDAHRARGGALRVRLGGRTPCSPAAPAPPCGLVVVAGGGGLAAEAIGLATGLPFGQYAYTGSLGTAVLGVPLVVPAAWIMMAYPSLIVGRRLAAALGRGRGVTTVLGAWALATWDVFLDPQMVEAGHWYWLEPWPTLPGVPGIPVSNFVGWLLVALLMMAALDRVLPGRHDGDDRLPLALWCWTFLSSTMAAAVFFGRPSVALVGGLLMGLVGVPLLVVLSRHGSDA